MMPYGRPVRPPAMLARLTLTARVLWPRARWAPVQCAGLLLFRLLGGHDAF